MPFSLLVHFLLWCVFYFMGMYFFYTTYKNYSSGFFVAQLFIFSLTFRLIGVVWYYYLYTFYNGVPFEAIDSDQMFYDRWGNIISQDILSGDYFPRLNFPGDYSDFGYPLFNGYVYYLFGNSILLLRIIQGVMSAISVIWVYHISKKFFNIEIARFASILAMLSPILIRYCGSHLKETVMIFLILGGTHFAIKAIGGFRIKVLWLIPAFSFYYSLFLFRTISGLIFFAAFALYYIYIPRKSNLIVKWTGIPVIIFLIGYLLLFSPAYEEISGAYDAGDNYSGKVVSVSPSKILKGVSILPVNLVLVFIGPFPNMLGEFGISNDRMFFQQIISAETFIKCLLAVIFLTGVYYTIKNGFKENAFLLSIIGMNLFVIAYTGLMLNLRHYLPIYPFLLMFSAAGLYYATSNTKKYIMYSNIFFFLLVLIFNYFKLGDFNLIQ